MDGSDSSLWSRWEVILLVFIVIASLVIAGGYISYNVISSTQHPSESSLVVKSGDQVQVDYVGMFADGTVFDTSILSVAQNDTLYPKSLSFNLQSAYSPLNFTVGSGQMILGFDKAVVGMCVNETKVVTIPAEQAYGYSNSSLMFALSLTETVPVYEWLGNATQFQDDYGVTPIVGTTLNNGRYGWNMTVFHVDPISEKVLVKNTPRFEEIVLHPDGWNSKVVSIDSAANNGMGVITLKHLIASTDICSKLYADEHGQQFFITDLDQTAGTFTVDYNREVVGKTLTFKITLVSLTPAA